MNWKELAFRVYHNRKHLITLYAMIFITGIFWIFLRKFLHVYTGFSFLFKNYILAMIPLIISSILREMSRMKAKRGLMILLGFLWIIFLPNAPYMITDYKYLWLDMYTYSFVAYLSWFILPAFLAGILSLNDIFHILSERFTLQKVNMMMGAICLLTGFGVALGSVLRLNTWDIGHQPLNIINTVVGLSNKPFIHKYIWAVTASYGFLLFFFLKALNILSKEFIRKEN